MLQNVCCILDDGNKTVDGGMCIERNFLYDYTKFIIVIERRKNMTRVVRKILYGLAFQMANVQANTSCILWAYQPKLPDEVKKMRKF